MTRCILHIDMDEFFAAVEKLDRPELRGKPLLVGGSPQGRGVVSTASYEARVFGCHSAMPMARAIALCPQATVLPVRFERYRQISEQVFAILGRFSPVIEPLSIDEAFLDVTGCRRLLGEGPEIAAKIKQAIRAEVGLTASLGVAYNKFLAKLASDLKKPDGLVVITEANVHEILDPLPVTKLWGVGPASAKAFERLNMRTIGQVRRTPLEVMEDAFGSAGEHYWRLAHGQDDRPVTPDGQAKSIGQEETFPVDVGELDELRRVLLGQAEHVARRLRAAELKARTITIKLRYGDFTTLTRSATLDAPSDLTDEIWLAAGGLLEAWAKKDMRPLRLIGVSVSNLTGAAGRQMSLFEHPANEKLKRLDGALDEITGRFGSKAISRARSMDKGRQE